MRTIKRVLPILLLLALALPAVASQTENCPFDAGSQFKYETDSAAWEPSDPGIELVFTYSNEGEVVAVTAPDGWVIVCAKVPQPDKGAGISHLIIQTTSTSTTTTVPENSTTTTLPTTSTTNGSTTTTSTPTEATTITTISATTTTTAGTSVTVPRTLPYTGGLSYGLVTGGLVSLLAGLGLIVASKRG